MRAEVKINFAVREWVAADCSGTTLPNGSGRGSIAVAEWEVSDGSNHITKETSTRLSGDIAQVLVQIPPLGCTVPIAPSLP